MTQQSAKSFGGRGSPTLTAKLKRDRPSVTGDRNHHGFGSRKAAPSQTATTPSAEGRPRMASDAGTTAPSFVN
jgi:hypothetical protein